MDNKFHSSGAQINDKSSRSLFQRSIGIIPLGAARPGQPGYANLSIYAFGLSGVWTGIGSGILPFKVLEVIESENVEILGYILEKNGALGIISLLGLVVAALVQLGSGALSDRDSRLGKRLPYLLVGGLSLAVMAVFVGTTTTFISLLFVILLMQIFGNFAQGPANALIADHVEPTARGEASGILNLWRLLGAGSVTVIVLQFMSRYDAETSPEWLWYSIILMIAVLIVSVLWTVIKVRPSSGLFIPTLRKNAGSDQESTAKKSKKYRLPITRSYLAFLVALAFSIAAMSSMQIYALFFLQDVVGLENPADGADILVVVIVLFAGATVLPAGLLADRVGRAYLFIFAGVAGVVSSSMLLIASSIGPVLAIGALIGVSVGLFMTLTWTVANDLIRRSSAARDLGYTSIATLIGAAAARFAGIGIDELNDVSENLGYKAILIFAAIAFALASAILTKVASYPVYGRSVSVIEPSTVGSGSAGSD